jgi:hypothetical protein
VPLLAASARRTTETLVEEAQAGGRGPALGCSYIVGGHHRALQVRHIKPALDLTSRKATAQTMPSPATKGVWHVVATARFDVCVLQFRLTRDAMLLLVAVGRSSKQY